MSRIVRIDVRVDPEEFRLFQNAAMAEDRKVNDWIRVTAKRVALSSQTVTRLREPGRITDATRRIAKNYTG